jgi:hypothetical protein
MSDEEVAAMARGDGKGVVRRIARHSPTKALGRLVSDKPQPPRISAAEMEQIQLARGSLPKALRERLAGAAEAEAAPPEPRRARKPSPKEEPPGKGSR